MVQPMWYVLVLIALGSTRAQLWTANDEEDGFSASSPALRGLKVADPAHGHALSSHGQGSDGSEQVEHEKSDSQSQADEAAKDKKVNAESANDENDGHMEDNADSTSGSDDDSQAKIQSDDADTDENEDAKSSHNEKGDLKDDAGNRKGDAGKTIRKEDDAHKDSNHGKKQKEKLRKEEEVTVEDIIKGDLVKKLIHPSRLMPFYMIPVAGSAKIIMQFLLLGFEIKMKPVNPEPACGACAASFMDWIFHVIGTVPLILLALNSWACDWQDFGEVSKLIPAKQHTGANLILMRMVIVVTSPNFVASIGVWGSIMAQSPKNALNLTPKYLQVPLLRGFPLNPFGTTLILPLKWCYAVMLAPYAIWALPGYLVIVFLQTQIFCTLMCCQGWTGCCTWFCSLIKVECCCMWSCCKCNFWTLLALITLGLWPLARQHYISYWPIIWTFGYFTALQLWCQLFPLLATSIYACCVGAGAKEVFFTWAVSQKVDPAAMASLGYQQPPEQQQMEDPAQQQIQQQLAMCLPALVSQPPLSTAVSTSLQTFNALNLSKDFDIDPVLLDAQKEAYKDKSPHHEVDKAKLAIIMAVLAAGVQAVNTQIVFLMILRLSLWMQEAVQKSDPWLAVTAGGTFMARAYHETLSERHWYTYLAFVKSLAMTSVHAMPRNLNVLWTLL